MPSDDTDRELVDQVLERIRARTRMRVGPSHRDQVLRASRSLAEARGLPLATWASGLDGLDAAPDLERIVCELTVGETYVFRGPVFDVLRQTVLPELVARRRLDGSRTLRVASAGCATGEEAYSLAACLADATREEPGFLAGVVGFDVNPTFLARAEEGRYRRWSLRGVDAGTLSRWFSNVEEEWVVKPELRALTRFQLVNLVNDRLPSPAIGLAGMDLILCQNVLLYFERDARVRVVDGLARSLAPGGLLFFGPSDLLGADVPHTTVQSFGEVLGHRRGTRPEVAARRSSRPVRAAAAASTRPPANGLAGAAEGLADPLPARLDAPGAPTEDVTGAPASYEAALALADAGDVSGALDELRGFLEAHHDHAGAHTLHGLLLTDGGLADEALVAFRRALYLEPDSMLALSGSIAAARKLGRHDLALRHASRLRAAAEGDGADRDVSGWEGMTARRLLQLARGAAGGA